MTKEQAKLFFDWDDNQNPHEVWEDKLFEFKQFFLTRPPIPQVFEARLKKLEKIRDAYFILTDQTIPDENIEETMQNNTHFPDEVIKAFNLQQGYRMKIKAKLLSAHTFTAIKNIISDWLAHEKCYQKKWKSTNFKDKEGVVISKEPDPMELLQAFREYESAEGVLTFEKVKNDSDRLPEMVKNESKRLNLLFDKSYGK
jgi:hypothetical protein